MDTNSSSARTYFRPTTASQRRLLFNTVEETANVSEAARRAHVGRGTYYYWLDRYEAEGLAGLEHERSRAPHNTRIPSISAELRAEVVSYAQTHPGEGYRSIANAICKQHDWQKVIGYTKVREIILEERQTQSAENETLTVAPSPAQPTVVYAERPNQTINIDLCVVPVTHDGNQAMTSVSVSQAATGAIPEATPHPTPPTWPGQVFDAPDLSYEDKMRQYVEQRTAQRASKGQRKHRRRQKHAERAELNARSDELRLKRRRVRASRRQEDLEWRKRREAHRQAEQAHKRLSRRERRQRRAERQAERRQWAALKVECQANLEQRRQQDADWRQARQAVRQQLTQLAQAPLNVVWFAILVIVDNATRRCLALPLFEVGVHVTADMIVAALRTVCPPELQFIISDNGTQFIAQAFTQFVQDTNITHVRIAPYRAWTNGIAERFVLTLKDGSIPIPGTALPAWKLCLTSSANITMIALTKAPRWTDCHPMNLLADSASVQDVSEQDSIGIKGKKRVYDYCSLNLVHRKPKKSPRI
jgi:transposase InsO family protein/transposase